ncbi:MAG: 30S ribosomal protein S27e [Candidatus Thermoplasmatota archaeon]|nr:30S ribosomal protein S27e [Candidatus Thermoplasmatota archaeon]
MMGDFVKVKCVDCNNEQIIFTKASTTVMCQVCGGVLAEPTGGTAHFKGKEREELS